MLLSCWFWLFLRCSCLPPLSKCTWNCFNHSNNPEHDWYFLVFWLVSVDLLLCPYTWMVKFQAFAWFLVKEFSYPISFIYLFTFKIYNRWFLLIVEKSFFKFLSKFRTYRFYIIYIQAIIQIQSFGFGALPSSSGASWPE